MLTHFQTRIALGSTIHLTLVTDTPPSALDEIFRSLWLMIFEFENSFSRFLPDSELSQFNRKAGIRQSVSPAFRELLHTAHEQSVLSDGLYNPFILPALQLAGYLNSMVAEHHDDAVDDFSSRVVVSADQLEVGDNWACIPYGTAIDIGGIGKGYIGDLLADKASSYRELQGYWFSLGGDIVTGGLNEVGEPWTIQIEDTTSRIASMAGKAIVPDTKRYAVATSSILRRKGVKNGTTWHHIIDPRTNTPADSDIATASICARSALLADMLASCAVIVGSHTAIPFAAARGAEGVLLQTKQRRKKYWGSAEENKPTRAKRITTKHGPTTG
jgi:thiamine biosynthesis lipoprotein